MQICDRAERRGARRGNAVGQLAVGVDRGETPPAVVGRAAAGRERRRRRRSRRPRNVVGDGAESARPARSAAAVEFRDLGRGAETARVQRLDDREGGRAGGRDVTPGTLHDLTQRVDRDQRVDEPGLRASIAREHGGGGGAQVRQIESGAERKRPVRVEALRQPVGGRRRQQRRSAGTPVGVTVGVNMTVEPVGRVPGRGGAIVTLVPPAGRPLTVVPAAIAEGPDTAMPTTIPASTRRSASLRWLRHGRAQDPVAGPSAADREHGTVRRR